MTLGEKIREVRRKCGFSQEQLAEKMSVSRSAIAKWETDKGLPDVGNLKILARLLNVSVDYLLDETEESENPVIRETYQLAGYGYGCGRVKKDRVVREKFPDATIYPLLGQQEVAGMVMTPDSIPDCRTGFQNQVKHTDREFYLIEKDDRQFFVTVTDVYIEVRHLENALQGNRFSLDGWNFIKCNYKVGI